MTGEVPGDRPADEAPPAMAQPESLASAPRCGARTRSGAPCRSPAVGGVGRCRMHGGKGSGAPRGNRNAWKHGVRSARFMEIARYVRAARPAAWRSLLSQDGSEPVKDKKRADNPIQRGIASSRATAHPDPAVRSPVVQQGHAATRLVPHRPDAPPPYSPRSCSIRIAPVPKTGCPMDRGRNDAGYRAGMIDRRQGIQLLGALLALGGGAFGGGAFAATPRSRASGQPFSWDWLQGHAAALARGRPRPLPQPDPRAHAVDYDAVNRISFRPEHALFADDGYAVRFFPISRYAATPVRTWVVEGGRARPIEHSADMFAVGPGDGPAPHVLPGISGFRVMNKGGVGDWLAFQGASYFRSAGALDQYGLSARGLAIDTGIDGQEEFPAFTDFWLERTGADGDGGLTIYALLEGPSVVGAYRFVNRTPGEVVQDVSMVLWLRKDVARLGIAPLTSMFWYDEGNPEARTDWRPEIHDSDGLLIHTSAGERLWRPLGNPPRATINSFADPKGASAYGLLQRDRSFDHYQDDGVFYEKRPSLWVEPKGDWGPGAVMLYEIPTRRETDDNIVAFWTPAKPARAGSRFIFDYRLRWMGGEPARLALARVVDRWTGTAGRPGTEPIADARRLVADFAGPMLDGLGRGSGVTATVSIDRGRLLSVDSYPVVGQPGRWRLVVDCTRSDQPANLRATLERRGAAISETLIHQFS